MSVVSANFVLLDSSQFGNLARIDISTVSNQTGIVMGRTDPSCNIISGHWCKDRCTISLFWLIAFAGPSFIEQNKACSKEFGAETDFAS